MPEPEVFTTSTRRILKDIIVVQGPTGTVHVADVDKIEEIYDLPAYTASPQQCGVVEPVDEDEFFACNFDPHRQVTLRCIFEHRDWWPSERRSVKPGRPPAHPAKTHK